MNTRIKVKAKNLFELLRVLDKSDETLCTLNLDLDISKTTIKLLDNYSDDWDFSDSETTENAPHIEPIIEDLTEEEEYTNTPSPKSGNSSPTMGENSRLDPEVVPTTYYNGIGVKDYNSLATLVEAIFSLYRQSPNIKFESGLFYNTLGIEYDNIASSPVTIEHSLLAMIIETYYKDAKFSEALDDTIGKLRGMWISKELSNHPNTTSLTKVLYGGK